MNENPPHLPAGNASSSGRRRRPQHLTGDAARRPEEYYRAKEATMVTISCSGLSVASSAVRLSLAYCALLAPSRHVARSLSLSATHPSHPLATGTLVDQARRMRELKHSGVCDWRLAGGQRELTSTGASGCTSIILAPSPDGDILSTALFGDDFDNSLASAIADMRNGNNVLTLAKIHAEEFDRLMEEDAKVASIVQENVKPGSLVDAVQQSRGADVVDMEALLQREAIDRRRSREARSDMTTALADCAEPGTIDVKARHLMSFSSIDHTSKPKPFSSSASLPTHLTREHEYALAGTIQAGTRIHKLKVEYEARKGAPLAKREWAQLAGMAPNDLRKLISDYRQAKQKLVSSNMGLVRAVVRNYTRKARHRGVSIDELIQEGSLGLIRAAELFDPAKGLRFSTYATIWIKGVLSNTNVLDEVITIPSRERVAWNKIRTAWDEHSLEEGKVSRGNSQSKPSVGSANDLAKILNMKQSDVETHLRRMSSVSNVLSLDYQYTSTTRSGYASDRTNEGLMSCASFGTDANLAEQAQFKADVVSGLVRNLTKREVTLMRLRYGLEDGKEYTIKECAAKMGINRETARLLQHACLKKLREASDMESLQEYLLTVA